MRLRLMVVVLCTALIACKDNNSNNGGNNDGGGDGGGGGNFAAITRTDTLPPGDPACANGGVKVHVGADNGDGGGIARDGVLQDGEIDKTETICAQAPANTVTRQTAIASGSLECPFGGTKVEFGLDNGDGGGTAGDGVLQDGEKDGSTNACANMPANLVVRTTQLFNGDPACPFGGTKVESGLDDGATPGDGILQEDEIDLTQNRCNPPPTDTFPAPTGADGTNVIDVRGGTGPGSGSGVGGGNGGQFTVANFAGPLAGSVEIHKNGTASPVAATSTATYTAGTGAAQLVITADTEVPVVTEALGSGPYVLSPAQEGESGFALFNGATRVTSIKVNSGGTLRFKALDGQTGLINVQLSGDVENAGTITAVDNGGTTPFGFGFYCHHFLNRAGGKVQGKGQRVAIRATEGTDGEIVNEAELSTRGADDAGASDAFGGQLLLLAQKAVTNTASGIISAKGGSADATAIGARSGGTVFTIAYAGSIRNGGAIEAKGGSGSAGGDGGTTLLWTGPVVPLLGSSFNNFGGVPAAVYTVPATPGTFDIDSSGPLDAKGGEALGPNGAGGDGGSLVIVNRGGDIRANGSWTVPGGKGTQYSSGDGGTIVAMASTLLLSNGAPLVPGEITLGTTMNASGGTGTGFAQRGGNGGRITISLDTMLQFDDYDVGTIGYGEYNPAQFLFTNFDRSKLETLAVKPRVQLLGVQSVNLTGGSSIEGGAGGNGGKFGMVTATCVDSCAFPHVKSHYVVTNPPVDVSGGAGAYTTSGTGGLVELLEFGSSGNQVAATVDAARVDVKGNLTGKGGGSTFTANSAGFNNLIAATGDVTVDGNLDFSGGTSTGGAGGFGGGLTINGFVVTVNGDVNMSGGGGTPAGPTSRIQSYAYRMQWNGDLTATGSSPEATHTFTAGQSVNVAGSINLSGVGASMGSAGRGADAGYLEWRAPTIANTGSITANGADLAGSNGRGGAGGSLLAYGGTWTKTGAVTLEGGGCTGEPCIAGGGGYLYLQGNATGTGVVSLKGGATTAAGATGGQGGSAQGNRGFFGVSCDISGGASTNGTGGSGGSLGANFNTAAQTLNGGAGTTGGTGGSVEVDVNSSTITANGGAATTGTGGSGGGIAVYEQNSGAINAKGGNSTSGAGGAGGEVYFGGTNSICAAVDGGAGTPAGGGGLVSGPNMCGT